MSDLEEESRHPSNKKRRPLARYLMSDPATISILPEGRGGTLELQKAISAHSTCLKCKSAASPITSRCGGGRRKRQYFQSVSMEMHRAAVSKVNSKHTGVTQVQCSLLVSRNDCTTGRVSLSHRERTARRRSGNHKGEASRLPKCA